MHAAGHHAVTHEQATLDVILRALHQLEEGANLKKAPTSIGSSSVGNHYLATEAIDALNVGSRQAM